MTKEKTLWKYIKKLIGKEWNASRHEDFCSSGIPDVSFGYKGINGWIELKYIPEFPKRKSTKIKIRHLTKNQCVWLSARGRSGDSCWILLQIEREYFLIKWLYAYHLKDGEWGREDLKKNSTGHWNRKIDKEEFLNLISKVTIDCG